MTLEQLNKLMDWFALSGGEFPITPPFELNSENLLVESKNSNVSVQSKKNIVAALVDRDEFLNFASKEKITNVYELCLFWLIKHYDKQNKLHTFFFPQKIKAIFIVYIENEKDKASLFYEEHTQLREIYPGAIKYSSAKEEMQFDSPNVEEILEDISFKLTDLKEPSVVLFLLKSYFDKPYHLAAFMVWLIEHNVSEETILNSGVLHKFCENNITTLIEENNPITVFYNLLEKRDSAKNLLKAVSETRFDERAFRQYNLKGQQCEKKLFSIKIIAQSLSCVSLDSLSVFKNLYQLFKADFFSQVLTWYSDFIRENSKIVESSPEDLASMLALDFLALVLNNKKEKLELSAIIESWLIKFEHQENIFKSHLNNLSNLINPNNLIERVTTSNSYEAFLLLSFGDKSDFYGSIPFKESIKKFLANNDIDIEKRFYFLGLLLNNSIENCNRDLMHFVFLQKIKVFLLFPMVLMDEWRLDDMKYSYRRLFLGDDTSSSDDEQRSSDDEFTGSINEDENDVDSTDSEKEAIEIFELTDVEDPTQVVSFLDQQHAFYKQEWEQLSTPLLEKVEFTTSDCKTLREYWTSFELRMNFFHKIELAHDESATSEYTSFEVTLLEDRSTLLGEKFKLTEILPILYNFSDANELFACQQMLVVIVAQTQGILLDEIIKFLSQNNCYWFLIPWDAFKAKSLLEQAVTAKNATLIKYLLEQIPLPSQPEALGNAFEKVIETEDLDLIKLFLKPEVTSQFSENEHDFLLATVMQTKSKEILHLFLEHIQLLNFSENLWLQAFPKIAERGDHKGLEMLHKYIRMYPTNSHEALIAAVKGEHWECVRYLCELSSEELREEDIKLAWEHVKDVPMFLANCNKRLSENVLWAGAEFFKEKRKATELLTLVKTTGKHQLTKDNLDSIFKYSISAPELISVADHIAELSDDRAINGQDVASAILPDIIHDGSSLLQHIYAKFDKKFHPDAKSISIIFTQACLLQDTNLINLLDTHAFDKLQKEELLIEFAKAHRNLSNVAKVLEPLCKRVNIDSEYTTSLLWKFFLQKKPRLVRDILSLPQEFYPNKETVDTIFSLALETNNKSMVAAFNRPIPEEFRNKFAECEMNELKEAVRSNNETRVKQLICARVHDKKPLDLSALEVIATLEKHEQLTLWLQMIRKVETYKRIAVATKDDLNYLGEVTDEALDFDECVSARNKEAIFVVQAIALLRDYTQYDSAWARFCLGHWDRHHTGAVERVLKTKPKSLDELLKGLDGIKLENSQGSLARRILYIKDFLLPLVDKTVSEPKSTVALPSN